MGAAEVSWIGVPSTGMEVVLVREMSQRIQVLCTNGAWFDMSALSSALTER